MSPTVVPLSTDFVVWRYPNRKLFIVGGKDYVNYSEIARRIRKGCKMSASDRRTGEDITDFILAQICSLETAKGKMIYPSDVLLEAIMNSTPTARVKLRDEL